MKNKEDLIYDTETESEIDSQDGGASEIEDDDNSSLEHDPDELDADINEDEKYDPINESEELEDPDEEPGEEEEEEEGEDEEQDEFEMEAKPCHNKNIKKDFIVLDEDDSNLYAKMDYKRISDEERTTDPIMTYYEIVRIIGTRAQQFNFGAEPLVKGLQGLHPAKMAYVELMAKMTPFIIRRHMPGKCYEEWKVKELEIIHQITDDFFVPENFNLV